MRSAVLELLQTERLIIGASLQFSIVRTQKMHELFTGLTLNPKQLMLQYSILYRIWNIVHVTQVHESQVGFSICCY
jgi:hypothetical protein